MKVKPQEKGTAVLNDTDLCRQERPIFRTENPKRPDGPGRKTDEAETPQGAEKRGTRGQKDNTEVSGKMLKNESRTKPERKRTMPKSHEGDTNSVAGSAGG